VPLNDLDAFADRCQQLVEDPAMRRALGATARGVAEALSIDRCADLYETTYRDALAPTARPHPESAVA
jgi:glycosyltransferase involved in cell wall biosynthesis